MTNGLLCQGFTQSKTDSCLFLRKYCILVVYVDGCRIFSQSNDVINDLIKSLSSEFLLQDEGNVSAFLGVQINKDTTTKTIALTQPGLIYSDPLGADQNETWNYRSIIGKLNYIANNTRPDISMAVH
jgi:hypothetical protein